MWINGIPHSAKDGLRVVIDGDCFLVHRSAEEGDAYDFWEFDRH